MAANWAAYRPGDSVEVRIDTRGLRCREWRRVTVVALPTLGGVLVRDWDDPHGRDQLVRQRGLIRPVGLSAKVTYGNR